MFIDAITRLDQAGFKTINTVEHFLLFSENEGKSVYSLASDRKDYHSKLRFYKVLSSGERGKPGLDLLKPIPPTADADVSIKLTDKGASLLSELKDAMRH